MLRQQNKTRAPIRRQSRPIGQGERRLWRPVSRAELSLIVRAAEKRERVSRLGGRRNGELGHIGLEVLRELARLIDHKTGRLDPAYDTIAQRLRRSRSAVAAALARLRACGWLDWVRRVERTGAETGPAWRQVSNAYAVLMPAHAAAALGHWGRTPAPPEDDEDRRRDATLTREAWEREGRRDDLERDNPRLFGALERLRLAVHGRESV